MFRCSIRPPFSLLPNPVRPGRADGLTRLRAALRTALLTGGLLLAGGPAPAAAGTVEAGVADLPVEGQLPALTGAVGWLNSAPVSAEALRGKVVLINFWTFDCVNCRNALPYVRAWAKKYQDHGLVVIGVHSPEFAFEKNVNNVRKAVRQLDLAYPVAIDNDFALWRAFDNRYWPANYFIDAQGRIRYHHFGEHDYEQSERVIQQLLRQAGYTDIPTDLVTAGLLADHGDPAHG